MLRSLGIAACAAAAKPLPLKAAEPPRRYSFERIIDLTHTLRPAPLLSSFIRAETPFSLPLRFSVVVRTPVPSSRSN